MKGGSTRELHEHQKELVARVEVARGTTMEEPCIKSQVVQIWLHYE